jgi:hypothetical protein
MMENPIFVTKFRTYLPYAQLQATASIFPDKKLGSLSGLVE